MSSCTGTLGMAIVFSLFGIHLLGVAFCVGDSCVPLHEDRTRGKGGGLVVSAWDLRPEGREFEPWPVHPRCVLRQNTSTLTVPLHPGV